MVSHKKISQKKGKKEKEEEDPIAEAKKRLEQQQNALKKIIEKFSQSNDNK